MMPKRRMSDMGFSGFPNEGLTFLAGLALNNDRAWFSAHKADYKDHVEGPAKCLLEALTPILSDLTGQPMGGKIFRIHRDVRFSKDKTPGTSSTGIRGTLPPSPWLHLISVRGWPKPSDL